MTDNRFTAERAANSFKTADQESANSSQSKRRLFARGENGLLSQTSLSTPPAQRTEPSDGWWPISTLIDDRICIVGNVDQWAIARLRTLRLNKPGSWFSWQREDRQVLCYADTHRLQRVDFNPTHWRNIIPTSPPGAVEDGELDAWRSLKAELRRQLDHVEIDRHGNHNTIELIILKRFHAEFLAYVIGA